MGMLFISKSNKVNIYSPSIRCLASKLRLISTEKGITSLVPPIACNQIPYESPEQRRSSNLEKLFWSRNGLEPQQGLQEVVKAHTEELMEAPSSAGQLSTAVYETKLTCSHSEPKAVELKVMDCPKSMKQKVRDLFPGEKLSHVSVLNLTQKTQNDMSTWIAGMEIEWMIASSEFVKTATEICKILQSFGYWADFIDPSSSKPYLSKQHTEATLNVTDEEYESLGFDISDLGCCRILAHKLWGTKVFVGTIFTDATINSPALTEIMSKAGARELSE